MFAQRPSLGKGGFSMQVTSQPERVQTGSRLTYEVQFGKNTIAPSITAHLPHGVPEANASGRGWTCTSAKSDPDSYVAAGHLDLTCANAMVSLVAPALTVEIETPQTAGTIRACFVGGTKGRQKGTVACVDTTVTN
jgi:hypothetical protein